MTAHSNNEATMCSLGSQSRRLTEGMKDLEKLNINTTLSSFAEVRCSRRSVGRQEFYQSNAKRKKRT
jgi:hypothetical protein